MKREERREKREERREKTEERREKREERREKREEAFGGTIPEPSGLRGDKRLAE